MKVKCINVSTGWFADKGSLTIGKIYEAQPVVLFLTTVTDISNVEFLIFNDKNQWGTYKTHLFVPEEEK